MFGWWTIEGSFSIDVRCDGDGGTVRDATYEHVDYAGLVDCGNGVCAHPQVHQSKNEQFDESVRYGMFVWIERFSNEHRVGHADGVYKVRVGYARRKLESARWVRRRPRFSSSARVLSPCKARGRWARSGDSGRVRLPLKNRSCVVSSGGLHLQPTRVASDVFDTPLNETTQVLALLVRDCSNTGMWQNMLWVLMRQYHSAAPLEF